MVGKVRCVLGFVLLVLVCGGVAAGEPYLGLSVRDSDHGPVVGWIQPGPLGGVGFDSRAGVRRSDLLHSVNGDRVESAESFQAAIRGMRPGDALRLEFRRAADAVARGAVPDPGTVDGEDVHEFTVEVEVAERDVWRGTIGRASDDADGFEVPDEGAYESVVFEEAASAELREAEGGLDALLEHLWDVQRRAMDPNTLPVVAGAFARPLSLDAVVAPVSALAKRVAEGDLRNVGALVGEVLAVDAAEIEGERGARPDGDLWAPIVGDLPEGYIEAAKGLVRQMRRSVYIFGDEAESHIRVIRKSPEIVEEAVSASLAKMRAWHAWVERVGGEHAESEAIDRGDLPRVVREAVEGPVLHYELDDEGRVLLVVGGSGANRYDMRLVACVYDVGGDNEYRFGRGGPRSHVVIDLAGNDRYIAEDDFAGPGTGVFGFGVIDDRGGDDQYVSTGQFSIGAGLFGVGVILDGGGHDRFENVGADSGWSMGVGFYGAGLVVSGGGNDLFLGEHLVQGVGGPRGFGAVINRAGDDLYRANGPNFPSVYGTRGVFATKGQGFGYGVRGYAAGGLGAIFDLAGNDRYEGGEFAQAGGYYFGMGVIHDFGGNDVYYGNRYGQAFAAHQAIGLLIDEGGDDTFWSMTAASQSGAWDESVTCMIVRGGTNSYRCDGLGQGAAAHQSVALLVADGGEHRFSARGGSVQGHSGSNEYHHGTSGVFSFSALVGLGAEVSTSGGRSGGQTPGRRNENDPGRSRLYGLFVDR